MAIGNVQVKLKRYVRVTVDRNCNNNLKTLFLHIKKIIALKTYLASSNLT